MTLSSKDKSPSDTRSLQASVVNLAHLLALLDACVASTHKIAPNELGLTLTQKIDGFRGDSRAWTVESPATAAPSSGVSSHQDRRGDKTRSRSRCCSRSARRGSLAFLFLLLGFFLFSGLLFKAANRKRSPSHRRSPLPHCSHLEHEGAGLAHAEAVLRRALGRVFAPLADDARAFAPCPSRTRNAPGHPCRWCSES